jgi:hypothetical protein
MSKLYFLAGQISQCVADAYRARPDQRRATFEQLIEGGAYEEDSLKEIPGMIALVQKSLKPALHLVHDEGIYIMPNCWFDETEPHKGQPTIAYALGCNPKTDGDRMDIWHLCRALVGGDDFCELLPMESIEPLLMRSNVTQIVVDITTKRIRTGILTKRKKRSNGK